MRSGWCLSVLLCGVWLVNDAAAAPLNLSGATVVIRGGDLPPAGKIGRPILRGEIGRGPGPKGTVTDKCPAKASAVIALSVKPTPRGWSKKIPAAALESSSLSKPEGFSIRLRAKTGDQPPAIFVTGA